MAFHRFRPVFSGKMEVKPGLDGAEGAFLRLFLLRIPGDGAREHPILVQEHGELVRNLTYLTDERTPLLSPLGIDSTSISSPPTLLTTHFHLI